MAVARLPRVKGFKSYVAKTEEVKPNWYIVDATDQSLGRMAAKIAMRLMGKDKPTYTPHVDTGDFVIVINAEKVGINDKRRLQKMYYRYSGFLGGRKGFTFDEYIEQHPDWVIQNAVRKMLPKNLLAKKMLSKLKVYAGSEHPHEAQQPENWEPLA